MCASGAKYGIMTAHFYWVGAIPAMMFVGVFMMPFYYGSRARSVPEYLKLRFDEKTRALNAVSFAVMTVFSSGISMYALGKLFQLVLGWSFNAVVLLSAAIVLVYTFLGGLDQRDLQRGPAILPDRAGLRAAGDSGGDEGRRLERDGSAAAAGDDARLEVCRAARPKIRWAWKRSGWLRGWASCCRSATGARTFWWCSEPWRPNSMSAARRTPLIAAFPKMIMPFIVIVPGIAAMALIADGRRAIRCR